jgi:hypothetical protein
LYLIIPSSILFAQDISSNINKATPEWVVSTDFISQSRGTSLILDSFGNSYSTGYFSDKIWLEDSIYVESCGKVEFNKNNHFLSKRDKNGTLLWIRYGIGNARTSKVLLDGFGNIYTIGYLWSNSLRLSSIKDSIIRKNKSYLHSNQSNIFICQYSVTGKVIRAKILPSQSGQVPNDCVLDDKGNFLIGGYYNYSSPDAPNTIKCSYSLVKLSPSWDILWTKKGTTTGQAQIHAIALDTSSNIYVTGGFVKSVVFSKDSLNGHHYENRVFLVQYNPDGELLSILDSLVPTPSSLGTDLAFDQQQNLHLLIHTQHSRSFLIKLNSKLQQIRSILIEGRQTINGLLIDDNNHIYLFGNGYTGNFGTTKYASKSHSYNNYNCYSFFIAKYNSHGSLLGLNIEGRKGGLNYCQDIALFKDKLLVLGTSNSGRELHFGSSIKKVAWYFNIWLASFNQDEFALDSQDQ